MIVHYGNKERNLGDRLVSDHSIITMMIDVSAHEVDLIRSDVCKRLGK